MQNKIEIDKMFFQRLNLRLAETEAERNRIQKELRAFKSSVAKASNRTTVVVVSLLAIASFLYTGIFHDAQSNLKDSEGSASNSLENGIILRDEQQAADDKEPVKERSLYARKKAASQRQWGPSLLMSAPATSKSRSAFDPVLKEQQKDLMTLGFNLKAADGFKGERTRQAIAEFRALYLPDSGKELKDADLAVIIAIYANLARNDAVRFGIDHGVVAAIRLSSVRTGVDFAYLMKLAATESNFKPTSKSATSSATGIYQFTHNTWLNALKKHGEKYGLVADYAAKIEHYETVYGYQRPIIRDKLIYQHMLDLRKNPRISAIMAAETVRDNQQKLASSFNREPKQTDLYLTHFLGADAAITFLQSLEKSPSANAVELFPEAASSNHDVFHPLTCAPRTVDEVYALFGEKFTTRRYDDFDAD